MGYDRIDAHAPPGLDHCRLAADLFDEPFIAYDARVVIAAVQLGAMALTHTLGYEACIASACNT